MRSGPGMAAADGFFLADGKDQRAVHCQSGYRGAADRSQRHDALAFPAEVLRPGLRSRVEQRKLLAGFRIAGGLLRPFPQRTRNARQRQVVYGGGPASRSWNDVIDVKRRFLPVLRQSTILAAFSRSMHHVGA
jgi:hypothetical protein